MFGLSSVLVSFSSSDVLSRVIFVRLVRYLVT